MYAVRKDNITIREMKVEDVMGLVNNIPIPKEQKMSIARALKQQIRGKTEEADMLFVILYENKVVGKIDIVWTNYSKDQELKRFKTDGNMIIEILPYNVCQEIGEIIPKMMINYIKETGLVDVLGIPRRSQTGFLEWEPTVIIPSEEHA